MHFCHFCEKVSGSRRFSLCHSRSQSLICLDLNIRIKSFLLEGSPLNRISHGDFRKDLDKSDIFSKDHHSVWIFFKCVNSLCRLDMEQGYTKIHVVPKLEGILKY